MVYLAGAADEQLADLTCGGEKGLITPDAVHVLFLQDVLLPIQGHFALRTVVALRHFGSLLLKHGEQLFSGIPGLCCIYMF